jgi:hypothetical protein
MYNRPCEMGDYEKSVRRKENIKTLKSIYSENNKKLQKNLSTLLEGR